MKNKLFLLLFSLNFIMGLLFMVTAAMADNVALDFEAYTDGSVNGQDGWSSLGSAGSGCAVYDHAVTAKTYGYSSFGTKSLRLSNAVTSGCFSDQTFSKSLVDEAGESTAGNGGLSGGTRQPYFEAQWDFASTVPGAEQPGLSVVASPDRGDGARMSWVQMKDTPGGLEVNFYDYQESAMPAVCDAGGNDFVFSPVASGLDRAIPHTIKLQMYLVDGPANDVVKIFVDGVLKHTGTSWEDYFRNCESNPTRTVDSILFRTGGAAAPATAGNGFLIDNINLVSGRVTQCTTDCYVDAINGNNAFGGTSFAEAKKSIQTAINQVNGGGTVHVAAGTYSENVNINKRVAIIGAGSGNDPAANTILHKSSNSALVTLAASGMSSTSPVLFKNLRVEPVNVYGFNVASGNVQYVEFDNVQVVGTNETNNSESEIGLKVATNASLSYLRVVTSAFDHLTYGWYFAKNGDWGPGGSNVTNVYVANTSFSHNDAKGIYVEKLSNATFDGCTVHNNGLNRAFFNAQWNAGFDINLKGQETYQNLIFNNMVVTNNGLGVANGAGFMIKARDDGATYGAHPASLDNVQINNSIFSGNTRAIRFGEPGKNNAGPTHVVLASSAITANTYGLVNATQATVTATLNWWDSQTGPTHSSNTGGAGNSASDNVTFTPWLCDGTDTSPAIGFQPNLILSSGGRCTGSITIIKQSEPAGATGFAFSGGLGSFNLNDGGSKVATGLTPGNYTITETLSPDWDLTNISCTGGSNNALFNGVTIQLAPGNDVSCTFLNQQHVELEQYYSYLPLIFKY
jgi:hypothetical protein